MKSAVRFIKGIFFLSTGIFVGLVTLSSVSLACGRGEKYSRRIEQEICDTAIFQLGRGWSIPVNLGPEINDTLDNCRPSVTPGGDTLYFETKGGYGDTDIWRSVWNKEEERWEIPANLGPNVNSKSTDMKPYISPDGMKLYFLSNRPGGYGDMDIYVATRSDSGWDPAVLMDPPINTPFKEGSVSISFDGTRLYFQSDRPGGYGNYDLWISRKIDENWGPPVNLGPQVNTSNVDWFALENPDGDRLYTTQLRPGGYGDQNLWYYDKEGEEWSLPVNVGLPINDYINCSPTMTGDGEKIFFGGGHSEEGYGLLDIWMSTYREEPLDTLYLPEVDDPDGWEKTGELAGASVVLSLVESTDGTILAGTYPGGRIYRMESGGEQWEIAAELPEAKSVFSLLRTRQGSILAGTFPNGDVFRSTDGGFEWVKAEELENATEVHCFTQATDGTIFAGTAPYGDVFISYNDGINWEAAQVPPETDAIATLLETADGTLLAGTFIWSGLFSSTDRGESWEEFGSFYEEGETEPLEHPSIGFLLELENGVLLSGQFKRGDGAGRGVYRSTDGGFSWFESEFIPSYPLIHDVFSLIEAESGNIYAGIATVYDYIVFRSTDEGLHWQRAGILSGARETYCLLEGSDGYIYAGTSPSGDVYRLRESAVGDIHPDEEEQGSTGIPHPGLGQNYPNPFNPTTVVPYSLEEDCMTELVIYNILGQKVKTLIRNHCSKGDHKVSWDGRDENGEPVASGIYFLRLQAGTTIEVKKMLLLR